MICSVSSEATQPDPLRVYKVYNIIQFQTTINSGV